MTTAQLIDDFTESLLVHSELPRPERDAKFRQRVEDLIRASAHSRAIERAKLPPLYADTDLRAEVLTRLEVHYLDNHEPYLRPSEIRFRIESGDWCEQNVRDALGCLCVPVEMGGVSERRDVEFEVVVGGGCVVISGLGVR
jgi:hypothetical protein